MLEMFVIQHASIYLNFTLIVLRILKKRICNFHYVAMPMMTSQILKFVDFTKTQISRERKIILSSNKKFINYKSRATLLQKIVL